MSQRVDKAAALEDLSVQVRRGQASRADERTLIDALAHDEVLQTAHQVGLDLDREAVVRAGDEDLILRAANAALARSTDTGAAATSARQPTQRSTMHATSRLVQVAAAAILMLSAGASAAWWVASASREAPAPAVQAKPAHAKRAAAKRVAPVVEETAPLSAPLAEAASERIDEAAAPRERGKRVVQDAAALFHAASVARGSGDVTRAQKLYGQLIAQHPDSDEAHVAHVALGKLWLSAGKASAAEREFRHYLDAGGGPLSEEALFSRAQALRRLDRDVEERAAWTKLLTVYPQSVYAAHARERLAEGDR